jgi:hypothetical protein
MLIFDKNGNEQTLAWLYKHFGPVDWQSPEAPQSASSATSAKLRPCYRLSSLTEIADPDPEAQPVPEHISGRARPEVSASIAVTVRDADAKPAPNVEVVFYWPDAPKRDDVGWLDRGVIGVTDQRGLTSFAMGGGAYYDPNKGAGPHAVWIKGDGVSDLVTGLGMILGTNHTHLDVEFIAAAAPAPPAPEDLLKRALTCVHQAMSLTKTAADLLETYLQSRKR